MACGTATGAGMGPPALRPPMPKLAFVDPDDFDESQFWTPEYVPESIMPPTRGVAQNTLTVRSTSISPAMIMEDQPMMRKTKIVCTMGPKCWDEESMGKLIDAGMGVARFNFSHGDHEAHQGVLDRFRKVCEEKKAHCAVLLDTKGPEIRTAMLKDHQPIELEAGQDIIVYAAGPDEYTEWEGYKTPEETKIGCSYAKLCQSVKPGNRLLFADGSVVIEVVEIIDEKNLKGKVINSKKLGERKNGNLPGVKVELDVLQEKDIEDIKEFACVNKMDYVAVSFVQCGDDVQMVRKLLDENGGEDVQIISKIENEEGMRNFDDILKYTDGVMVARGDLGMEIPSEKVPLAQKMLITKSNVAGRFCICATQMLESMCTNPLPTRAEMTDVANAVFDGADATMLSGETANGANPAVAVATMAAISANAELAHTSQAAISFIRDHTQRPFTTLESAAASAAGGAVDCDAELIVVVTGTGAASRVMSKYRPSCPVLVVTADEAVGRQTGAIFAQFPMVVDDLSPGKFAWDKESPAIAKAKEMGLYSGNGSNIVVLAGPGGGDADKCPLVSFLE